jgi:hypothetical protein
MPTIHIEAEVGQDDLLRAVEQLNSAEFDQFVSQVLTLRARRKAPGLLPSEAELLLRINQDLPEELRLRYEVLIGRRRDMSLTPDEQIELQQLTDQVENCEADRVRALADLARIRGVSLSQLMTDLGVTSTSNG